MTRMKTLCMALFTVFALTAAFSATSVLAALPDVHLLSGEAYPASGSGSVTGKEEAKSSASSKPNSAKS